MKVQKMDWICICFGFNWIDIGVFKNFKECARSPCNGNHFSSIYIGGLRRHHRECSGVVMIYRVARPLT